MRNASILHLAALYCCHTAGDQSVPTLIATHDPAAEPYTAMSRDELADGMDVALRANDSKRLVSFYLYFMDRCSPAEQEYHNLGTALAKTVAQGLLGAAWLDDIAPLLRITRRVFDMLDDVTDEVQACRARKSGSADVA
jgi:hypothetical protein